MTITRGGGLLRTLVWGGGGLLRTLAYGGVRMKSQNPGPKIWVHQNSISEILVHDANLLPENMGAKFCF